MTLRRAFIGAVAATVLLGLAALAISVGASAQEPQGTPPAGGSARFADRVAANLGVTPDALRQAVKDAALQAVDEAESSGRITSEQAEAARERINSGKGLGLRGLVHRHHQRAERLAAVRRGIIESSATAIGIEPAELRDQLRNGESIASVAESHGVTVDDVEAQITSDAEEKLTQAVENGRITEERKQQVLDKLNERLDEILNRTKDTPPASQ
jgi:hypothetical protein